MFQSSVLCQNIKSTLGEFKVIDFEMEPSKSKRIFHVVLFYDVLIIKLN